MTAVSLLTSLSPAKVLGTIAGGIAESAKGKDGLAGAFSDAWTGLDANKDGTLNGQDVLGNAMKARNALLQGIADAFDYDTGAPTRNLPDAARTHMNTTAAAADRTAQDFASGVQLLISSAPAALPSAAAARAVENLPGVAEIRATYTELRNMR